MRARRLAPVVAALLIGAPAAGSAAEFRAIGAQPAILYDAPSAKARKLWILSSDYPVEVIVTLEGFTKIRDAQGQFSWVESRALSERRTVLVRSSAADLRAAADEQSPVVARIEQNVLLELMEPPASGWARVRHRDGATGFLRLKDLWGV